MKGLSIDKNYATYVTMSQLPYIVIGDGIAARTLIFYLSKYAADIPILQIYKNDVFPQCSLTTTSVNCLRGTAPGLSALGDLIIESYHEFESFYKEYAPVGIDKSFEYQLWEPGSPNKDKWARRYSESAKILSELPGLLTLDKSYYAVKNDAYIITHQEYLKWLLPNSINRVEDVVTDVIQSESGAVEVHTKSGKFQARKCFICAGIFNKNFSNVIEDSSVKHKIEHAKASAGTYARIPAKKIVNKSFNLDQSFAIALENINFIYRKDSQEFLIGATTENNSLVFIPNKKLFAPMYHKVQNFLQDKLEIPEYEEVELICGVREKGQRRTPFWGEVAPDIYMVSGLYKNAFTFANLAAKDLIQLVK